MHNSIVVSFIKGLFTVTAAINLQVIQQFEKLNSADEANKIAHALLKKYQNLGVEIEIFQPW